MRRFACTLVLCLGAHALKTQPQAQDDEKIFAAMNAAQEQQIATENAAKVAAAAPAVDAAAPAKAAPPTDEKALMRDQAQQMLGKAAQASDVFGNWRKMKEAYAKLSPAEKAALAKKYWSGIIAFWLVWTILGFLVGHFVYQPKPVTPEEKTLDDPDDPIKEIESQHFGCLEDPYVALCSCFCPQVRWAYNMEEAGFMKYWQAFLCFSVCIFLNWVFKGNMSYGIATCILCMYMRKKLREKLEMEYGCMTAITDAAYALFCNCCLIAQEARALKAAQFGGHEEFEIKPKQVD